MTRLQLSVAMGDYDRTRALFDGRVQIDGVDPVFMLLNPAEMFGVGDRYGSLDVGKVANVVVANGDPLDVRTSVKQVFIEGVAIPMTSRQTDLRDEYAPLMRK